MSWQFSGEHSATLHPARREGPNCFQQLALRLTRKKVRRDSLFSGGSVSTSRGLLPASSHIWVVTQPPFGGGSGGSGGGSGEPSIPLHLPPLLGRLKMTIFGVQKRPILGSKNDPQNLHFCELPDWNVDRTPRFGLRSRFRLFRNKFLKSKNKK